MRPIIFIILSPVTFILSYMPGSFGSSKTVQYYNIMQNAQIVLKTNRGR